MCNVQTSFDEKLLSFEGFSIDEVAQEMDAEELRQMAYLTTESLYYSIDLFSYHNKRDFNQAEKEEITHLYVLSKFIEQIAEGTKEGSMKLFEYIYNYL